MPVFLDLPVEIRLDVFEYVITAAKPGGSRAWNNTAHWRGLIETKQLGRCSGRRCGDKLRPNALPLLLTNRQIYSETIKCLSRVSIVYELDLYPPSAPHRDDWFYHWRYIPAFATIVEEVVIHVPGLIFQGQSRDSATRAFTRSLYHRAPILQLLCENGRCEITRIVIDLECELLAWSGSAGDWSDLKNCLVEEFDSVCRHLSDQTPKVRAFWRDSEVKFAAEMIRVSLNGEFLKETWIDSMTP